MYFLYGIACFIQRQRYIIRKHTEAVDHLAGNALQLIGTVGFPPAGSGLHDEFIYQHFVKGVVNVTVQHIGLRNAVTVSAVLSVIAEHRIM